MGDAGLRRKFHGLSWGSSGKDGEGSSFQGPKVLYGLLISWGMHKTPEEDSTEMVQMESPSGDLCPGTQDLNLDTTGFRHYA